MKRNEGDELKTERLHMLIGPSELEAVDDWRFKNRVGSRAEAVRRLAAMSLGIQAPARRFPAAIDKLADIFEGHLKRERELVEQAEAGAYDHAAFADNADATLSALFRLLPQFSNDALAVWQQTQIAASSGAMNSLMEKSHAAMAAAEAAFFDLERAKEQLS